MARDRSRSPTAGGKDWEADGWPAYKEYWRREAALKDMGLDVKLLFDNDEGFISFTVQILCGFEFRDVPPPDRRGCTSQSAKSGSSTTLCFCSGSPRSGAVVSYICRCTMSVVVAPPTLATVS